MDLTEQPTKNVAKELSILKQSYDNLERSGKIEKREYVKNIPEILEENILNILNLIFNMEAVDVIIFSLSALCIKDKEFLICTERTRSYMYSYYRNAVLLNANIALNLFEKINDILKKYTTERFYMPRCPLINKKTVKGLSFQILANIGMIKEAYKYFEIAPDNMEKPSPEEIVKLFFQDMYFYTMKNTYIRLDWFLGLEQSLRAMSILDFDVVIKKQIQPNNFFNLSEV